MLSRHRAKRSVDQRCSGVHVPALSRSVSLQPRGWQEPGPRYCVCRQCLPAELCPRPGGRGGERCCGAAGTSLPGMQPWSWVSHPCVFPIKPDRSGPQSPGTGGGGHRLSLEGTCSLVPSAVPSPPSWPVSPRSSFRSPLKQPEHGAGGAPRPLLTLRLAAALDPPGGAEQALPMIVEDQERVVLGHRPRRQVPLVPCTEGEDGGGRTPKMGSAGLESIRETWTPAFAPSDFIFNIFSGSSSYRTECCLPGVRGHP